MQQKGQRILERQHTVARYFDEFEYLRIACFRICLQLEVDFIQIPQALNVGDNIIQLCRLLRIREHAGALWHECQRAIDSLV